MKTVTLPLNAVQADEVVRELCSSVVPLLKTMNTTFNHIDGGKIPFLDSQPGAGINGFPKHTDLEQATLQLYYWGEDGPTREELATAIIMLPEWLVKSMLVWYNCIRIVIPVNLNEEVLVEFIRETPNEKHKSTFIDHKYLVDGLWESVKVVEETT